MSDSFETLWIVACQAPLCFLGKNIGVVCHFLLQGIFPTQELDLYLLHYRQTFFFFFATEQPGKPFLFLLCFSDFSFISFYPHCYGNVCSFDSNHWMDFVACPRVLCLSSHKDKHPGCQRSFWGRKGINKKHLRWTDSNNTFLYASTIMVYNYMCVMQQGLEMFFSP